MFVCQEKYEQLCKLKSSWYQPYEKNFFKIQ